MDQVEVELATRYLDHFIKQSWHLIEPAKGIVNERGLMEPLWNWHLDAICEHLQACVEGEIRNLLINVPPRHTKSICTAVNLVPWAWVSRPSLRVIYSSYAEKLSIRDSIRGRRIVQSPWYQERWGDRFQITNDQNEKLRWENDLTGYRVATSTGGLGTGEGGDGIVADDPHNVRDGESSTKRESTLLWWDEVMSTRLDDPKTGFKIIIMQRVHERDLSGHVLEKGTYEHLCLPARYEAPPVMVEINGEEVSTVEGQRVPQDYGPRSTRFEDPRRSDGALLNPKRYGLIELDELEAEMGVYASAGQLQQRPAPREGGMFHVDNFIYRTATFTSFDKVIRYWDKAGTEGGGARTAGVKMGRTGAGYYVVLDVVKGQWSAGKREKVIKDTALEDGVEVEVWTEQEPGSGGKESAENTIKNLEGFTVRADRATGDKEVRAEPYAAHLENHGIYVMVGPWNKDFVEEHQSAPRGKFKDQWDSASGAFNKLNSFRTAGVW